MKVKEFIEKLERLKPSLQDLDIVIQCPNGLLVEPEIKMLIDWPVEDVTAVIIKY